MPYFERGLFSNISFNACMCVPVHEIASGKNVQRLDDLLPLCYFNTVHIQQLDLFFYL